jgi:hypothetical protein
LLDAAMRLADPGAAPDSSTCDAAIEITQDEPCGVERSNAVAQ